MPFNPQIHNRRSIRLKDYDYSKEGAYYVTIVCYKRICRFGSIELRNIKNGMSKDATMIFNEYGKIAYEEWIKLPERFPNVELDVFQIMPNHLHGIIILKDKGQLPSEVTAKNLNEIEIHIPDCDHSDPENITEESASKNPILGDIIGAFKSLTANACLAKFKSLIASGEIEKNELLGKIWHRNYFEHIIRNEESYNTIANYIIENPNKWQNDIFNKI